MIVPITMYGCQCDKCGESWFDDHSGLVAFTDKSSIQDSVSDDWEWLTTEDDKHYCRKCRKEIEPTE